MIMVNANKIDTAPKHEIEMPTMLAVDQLRFGNFGHSVVENGGGGIVLVPGRVGLGPGLG